MLITVIVLLAWLWVVLKCLQPGDLSKMAQLACALSIFPILFWIITLT